MEYKKPTASIKKPENAIANFGTIAINMIAQVAPVSIYAPGPVIVVPIIGFPNLSCSIECLNK